MMTPLARLNSRHQRDYSPVPWTQYFDEALDIQVPENPAEDNQDHQNTFRVYLRNFCEPYAPKRDFGKTLDPSTLEATQAEISEFSRIPTIVALHGGGYSALTWAQFTRHIEQLCHCRLLALDLRGHGDSKTTSDDHMDIETLVVDVISVIHETHKVCGFHETPRILIVGHSMGGAIAIKCSKDFETRLPSLSGFVVIDVVEGTAKEALPLMMSVINTRPSKFPSLANAIEWSVRSGMAKNSEAARVSMPGNLVNISTEHLAIHDVPYDPDDVRKIDKLLKHKFHVTIDNLLKSRNPIRTLPPNLPLPTRVEMLKCSSLGITMSPLDFSTHKELPEDESLDDGVSKGSGNSRIDNEGYQMPPQIDTSGYCWRTDLAKTEPFWGAWFEGLSEQLLNSKVQAKFLLLAGIDRLDKTLTIGHMQGKFMMKVLPKCGHAVHEDVPEQVAAVIGDFLLRNKLTTAVESTE